MLAKEPPWFCSFSENSLSGINKRTRPPLVLLLSETKGHRGGYFANISVEFRAIPPCFEKERNKGGMATSGPGQISERSETKEGGMAKGGGGNGAKFHWSTDWYTQSPHFWPKSFKRGGWGRNSRNSSDIIQLPPALQTIERLREFGMTGIVCYFEWFPSFPQLWWSYAVFEVLYNVAKLVGRPTTGPKPYVEKYWDFGGRGGASSNFVTL